MKKTASINVTFVFERITDPESEEVRRATVTVEYSRHIRFPVELSESGAARILLQGVMDRMEIIVPDEGKVRHEPYNRP